MVGDFQTSLADYGELITLPFYTTDAACPGMTAPLTCAPARGASRLVFDLNSTSSPPRTLTSSAVNSTWSGHVVAILRWSGVLKYGLSGLPLDDIDVVLYNAPASEQSASLQNASLFDVPSSSSSFYSQDDARTLFLALNSGRSVFTTSPGLNLESLSSSDQGLVTATKAAERATVKNINFAGRKRNVVIAARPGFVDGRRSWTPLLILLLSLASTNLKDAVVAAVLMVKFLWMRRQFLAAEEDELEASAASAALEKDLKAETKRRVKDDDQTIVKQQQQSQSSSSL